MTYECLSLLSEPHVAVRRAQPRGAAGGCGGGARGRRRVAGAANRPPDSARSTRAPRPAPRLPFQTRRPPRRARSSRSYEIASRSWSRLRCRRTGSRTHDAACLCLWLLQRRSSRRTHALSPAHAAQCTIARIIKH